MKTLLRVMAMITSFAIGAQTVAQESNVDRELKQVIRYFSKEGGPTLLAAQSLLITFGAYNGKPDGNWGTQTEEAFRNVLQSYISIGGRGRDWGVNRPADTKRFMDWIASAAYAKANDLEFPD